VVVPLHDGYLNSRTRYEKGRLLMVLEDVWLFAMR